MNILDELQKLKNPPYIRSREGVIRKENSIFLFNLLKHLSPRTVLEIGFNQGHGALTILHAIDKDAKLQCVDIGVHDSAHNNAAIFEDEWPNFNILFGDSTVILDSVCSDINPIDFCVIDGGHTYDICMNDIKTCLKHMHDDAIIWVDDYRRVATKPDEKVYVAPGVNKAGDEMREVMNSYHYELGGILVLSKRSLDFIDAIDKP